MEQGRDPDDEVGALEAVWGREASATAPGAPRPDLEALLDPSPPGADATGDTGHPTPGRRSRRLLVAGVVAAAGVVVAGLVLVGLDRGEGGGRAGDADRPPASATTDPPAVVHGPPAWAASAVCPRLSDETGAGSVACPVAIDDERAYVVEDAAGVPTVRARDVGDGGVWWEAALDQPVRGIVRLASVVLVDGFAPGSDAVALDPATGNERWRHPGRFVTALGRDHVLLDHEVQVTAGTWTSTTAVVDAATGATVLERMAPTDEMDLHPCGEAGLVVALEEDALVAHGVADGRERWSVPAPDDVGGSDAVGCDDRWVAYVAAGTLHLHDAATGAEVASATVTDEAGEAEAHIEVQTARVVGVAGGTVVVGSIGGDRGYRAGPDLRLLWDDRCGSCAREGAALQVGSLGRHALVLLRSDGVEVRDGADGSVEARLDLPAGGRTRLEGDTVLAWGPGELVVADAADLARPSRLAAAGVRRAAAATQHVVVTTADEVRVYPREG